MKRLCVFCGSNAGTNPIYRAEAEKLGRLLAARGIELVYGAGNIGLMGAVADACLAAGGTVIGIIPEALMGKEVAGRAVDHRALTRIEVVDSMHTRKARMAELSDGFIALPGGFGTLDELLEAMTLVQTKKSRAIPIILVDTAFWQGLLDWLRERLVGEGMISAADLDLVQVIDKPEDVVEAIFKHYEKRGFTPLAEEHEMMLNL